MTTKLRKIQHILAQGFSYTHRMSRCLGSPRIFAIESTNYCNVKCIMCPVGRGEMKRERGFMTPELLTRILDENGKDIYNVGTLTFLHNFGEPLLNPSIFELIKLCKAKGIRCGISTNATLLDTNSSKNLLESGLDWIMFAFDGFKKETYEKIRIGAHFGEVKSNILRFLAYKKESGAKLFTIVQILKMIEISDEEAKDFCRFWENQPVDCVSIKDANAWGGQLEEMYGSVIPLYQKASSKTRYPCARLWESLVILWDGTVTLCCRDYDAKYPLGNVKESRLIDMWNGERMTEARKAHISGNFERTPPCTKCIEWYGGPSSLSFLYSLPQGIRLIKKAVQIEL